MSKLREQRDTSPLATRLKHLNGVGCEVAPQLFLRRDPNTEVELRKFCETMKVWITERSLPGSTQAVAWSIEGAPVIVLNANARPTNRAFLIAHELAHVLLGHLQLQRLAKYGETMNGDMSIAFKKYDDESEKDADLFGLLMLWPEPYLYRQVLKHAYIPAKPMARKVGLPDSFAAARNEAYRKVHGYAQTLMVLKTRMLDNSDFSLGPRNWERQECEMSDCDALDGILSGRCWETHI